MFNQMVEVTKTQPEKFFMNVEEFNGHRLAMFDYSMVMTNHFDTMAARNCRGSVIEIDQNGQYLRTVCWPFEKFFNAHEMYSAFVGDTAISLRKQYGIPSDTEISDLEIDYVFNKEDGSIISTFMLDDTLYVKSSSSYHSPYAQLAMELIKSDKDLYEKVIELETSSDEYTVMFELLCADPLMQVVLEHNENRLVVLGARSKVDGHYMSHEDMKFHFGDRVVPVLPSDMNLDDMQANAEGIEGVVVQYKCGLRLKYKCKWYLDRHKYKDNIGRSPKYIWRAVMENNLDDYIGITTGKAQDYVDMVIKRCQELHEKIIHNGVLMYEELKDLPPAEFFKRNRYDETEFENFCSGAYAALRYRGESHKDAVEQISQKMCERRYMSRLGILEWTFEWSHNG